MLKVLVAELSVDCIAITVLDYDVLDIKRPDKVASVVAELAARLVAAYEVTTSIVLDIVDSEVAAYDYELVVSG